MILRVSTPLYLLNTRMACWKCGRLETVVALGFHSGTETDEGEIFGFGDPADRGDLILLTYIGDLPGEVLTEIVKVNPCFASRSSRTVGSTYFANSCACGALFGDHYLCGEPGEAFFPTTAAEAAAISYRCLPFDGLLPFRASYSHGTGGLVLAHGKKEA